MKKNVVFFLIFLISFAVFSQEENESKTKLTNFLSKSYYSINLGGIFYPFSNDNLIDGYKTETFSRNWFSGRLLLGHKLTGDLAVQFGTMRPASWFKYDNVNNIGYDRSVWINAWSLSLKKDFKLHSNTTFYAEAGIANLTRFGFSINDKEIYKDAHYASLLYGFGVQHKLNDKWRLSLNGTFLPKSTKQNQPSISQVSLGFEYHLQQLQGKKALQFANNDYFFPKNIFQVSYGTSAIGFGVNRFFGMSLKVGNFESFGIPIFWVGEVKAKHAFSLTYQRLIFRTEKIFSLDWGTSITAFQSELTNENVFAFSIFPVLRFYLLRKKGFDFYTNYSIIGPTYLTKSNIDGLDSGPKITYQDTMGFGFFFGKKRAYNFELRIMHYSNGNIFTKNDGVAVPLQFTLGKTF
ncbi:Lipid A 3-O-deacylase (PagL) [Polaribacter sp. KT25b]|uniref:acyloxyacyl hydrolase n=1 Tax=Polaribacter sp. KT25b TaxID=1855336 RepID=UPI0008797E30|nr:acyloxyacyl hydrolase [Polaribacter sp. KT25b]SDR68198.1 Lipid A 3-O-deacylase (PagL) [Polaribacter sp. KT25b]